MIVRLSFPWIFNLTLLLLNIQKKPGRFLSLDALIVDFNVWWLKILLLISEGLADSDR